MDTDDLRIFRNVNLFLAQNIDVREYLCIYFLIKNIARSALIPLGISKRLETLFRLHMAFAHNHPWKGKSVGNFLEYARDSEKM